jgi:hypothetical protein
MRQIMIDESAKEKDPLDIVCLPYQQHQAQL